MAACNPHLRGGELAVGAVRGLQGERLRRQGGGRLASDLRYDALSDPLVVRFAVAPDVPIPLRLSRGHVVGCRVGRLRRRVRLLCGGLSGRGGSRLHERRCLFGGLRRGEPCVWLDRAPPGEGRQRHGRRPGAMQPSVGCETASVHGAVRLPPRHGSSGRADSARHLGRAGVCRRRLPVASPRGDGGRRGRRGADAAAEADDRHRGDDAGHYGASPVAGAARPRGVTRQD
mmetsp:Transcript_143438/g.357418  ORF Transcript_143438/g.357418 Transcript_143438/m.357418 type:complete len:230 (-) Transcript_143438:516-1205(-)